MRNLLQVAGQCMKELDTIGIKYGKIVKWEIATRTSSRWGQCKYFNGRNNKDGYSINISYFLLDERNDIEVLKNTIIHELLHSCEDCMNHGARWKALAGKVNNELGYLIQRCATSAEAAMVAPEVLPKKKVKHKIQCTECGKTFTRSRMCDVVKHPSWYSCGKCGGKLKVLF